MENIKKEAIEKLVGIDKVNAFYDKDDVGLKLLIIVDMQEKYIGKNNKYDNAEELINNINLRISQYKNNVIYIKNTALKETSNLIEELNVVTNNIFLKSKASCFSNEKIKKI